MAGSATNLPNQIPPQSATWGHVDAQGNLTIDENVWLFLYNLAAQVLTASTSVVVLPPAVNIPMVDIDVVDTDSLQDPRRIINAMLLQESPDTGPSLRDVANALVLAADDLPQDPIPRAQPASAVAVGASPFTFTAPFTGSLAVQGGTVSAITVIRNGLNVATGVIAGMVPMSRLDQVQITYSAAPTVGFLPT